MRSSSSSKLNNLPPYTGIQGVNRIGMSVEQCTQWLSRLAGVRLRSMQIAAARMTGTPEWELKASLGRWIWEDAVAYRDLETRLTEMRSRPSDVTKALDYQLGDLMNEILHSPGSLELCVGYFDVLEPAFISAIEAYIDATQPLVDWPSIRILKQILVDARERLEVGRRFIEVLGQGTEASATRADWIAHYKSFLAAAGGILGNEPLPPRDEKPTPRASEDYRISREFLRDERFKTSIPKVPPKQFEGNAIRTMMWVRSQEMTAAELMASVIYEWEDLPTEALVDLARHCWDEVRHSLMGQAALEAEGIKLHSFPSWIGYAHHTLNCAPVKRYSHLAIATEFGAMVHPGGKRGEWELARDIARHPLMTTFQDFDWADEVNHVKFGREWIVNFALKGDRQAALKMGDETKEERLAYYAKFTDAGGHHGGY